MLEALARDYATKTGEYEELLRRSSRNSSYQLSVQLSNARSAVNLSRQRLLDAALNHVAA
jgi:hypothetical protein